MREDIERFLAKKSKASTQIPTWKYCRECCEKLGIDFEKQKPSDYRTDEQNLKLEEKFIKMQEKKKENVKG